MTSLDGHGISLTVLRLFDKQLLEFIDAPTSAPGWHGADKLGKPETAPSADKGQSVGIEASSKGVTFTKEQAELAKKCIAAVCDKMISMESELNELDSAAGDGDTGSTLASASREQADIAKKCITAVCEKMISMESELNELDSAAGDGDTGSTLASASKAISERMKTLQLSSAQQLLFNLSEVFEQAVGGTGGALYALMLSAASNAFSDSITSKGFKAALIKASEAVQEYGGAKPGYRTLVDPLDAATQKIKGGEDNWDVIIEAANKAAQATAGMIAKAGRASYTAKEVQTKPDPGAVAISALIQTI
ncbi:DAK2 domain protein, partial [Oesophagostomum dentatum]